MLWVGWPRWLADQSLPLLGAVLMQKTEKKGLQSRQWRGEVHPYYDLQVKVLRARNIRCMDLLSKADCFVQLRLPTASPDTMQTRTVYNCSNPEWNETFHFRLQSVVKNILELSLNDKDIVVNDQIFQMSFDPGILSPGKPYKYTFRIQDPKPQELQVEFVLEESQLPASEVITNGVLVAQPCLRVQGSLEEDGPHSALPRDYGSRYVLVSVPGAPEKPQRLALQPTVDRGLPTTFCFHMNPVVSPRLEVALEEKLQVLQSGLSGELETQTSKLGEGPLPLSSVPLGCEQRQTVALGKDQEVTLRVKAEMSSGDLDVRLGFDLSDGEKQFLDKRKSVVSTALQSVLGLSRAPDQAQVPVVAVLGSGGGARAMSALYGSLAGLQELGVLDTVTYLGGVSGSTWCISTLYKDPAWSQGALQGPIEHARARVCSSKTGALSTEQLQYYAQEVLSANNGSQGISLVDLWGLLIEYFLHQKENPAKLSDQQKAVIQGQNPYPIYAGINVHSKRSGEDFAEWCEFTPHEVGFPKYGAYIPTELFGSEFFMGRLLQPRPEPRICYLQGIWGSAFAANLEEICEVFLKPNNRIFLDGQQRGSVDNPEDVGNATVGVIAPQAPFSQVLQNLRQRRFSADQKPNFLRGLGLHRSYETSREFLAWKKNHLDSKPNELTPMWDCLKLVDAGLAINSPFPLCLSPHRAVDLILSFDYALSSPFEVLQVTERYCRERGIPFPRIQVRPEDLEEPQECYLFAEAEDPRSPIVLHFPLVNRTFRTHRSPGVERQTAEDRAFGEFSVDGASTPYGTTNFTYTPEEFERLVALSRYNVLNQAGRVRQALELALRRRQEWGAGLEG
ncbi:cytosolic phospholipase A2 zeta [Sorex fumeus]|uniref:cytosolic phospholipase A2 zeta n=1 Tax=Sorex fumeus TaxID=62283 RepID=UPI0024AD3523|nr:cytosolic phospholipase A2 zeta [Sorex fumeus]